MTNELAFPLNGGELRSIQEQLYALLAHRAALYGGGSSSLPVELAQDLLDGLYFTLNVTPDDLRPLLGIDLEEAHRRGIVSIQRRIHYAKQLWETARESLPPLGSISLTDTMRSIGRCWRGYDYRWFPQTVPCEIDYQLCRSVPETLLGVDYVTEYLKRLIIENDLLRRFDPPRAAAVLRGCCPDYRSLLVDLAEPIAVNALGLILLGKDPLALDINDADREDIAALLAPLPPALRVEALEQAAEALCGTLGIASPRARDYWRALAAGLVPRIGAALEAGDLGGIFLPAPVL